MKTIDSAFMARFVDLLADRLKGEWVVIGGAVLPLVGIEHRVTYDIDLAGPNDLPQTLELLLLAEEMGLPPEAVNQAGAFFLRRIPGWRRHLVLLRRGREASVFRPDATLFVLLKLGRLSETDLEDCYAYLGWAKIPGDEIETRKLISAVETELGKRGSKARKERLHSLSIAIRSM